MRAFHFILVILILLAFSCASYMQMEPMENSQFNSEFYDLLKSKELEQHNSAYLVEVKLKTPHLKKKFKLEIYAQADSISFYSPGFLGKGTFKGIIYGDSLRFYLPSEKAYYMGLWYDLTEPDLRRWKDLFRMTMNFLGGSFLPDQDEKVPNRCVSNDYNISGQNETWCWNFKVNKMKLSRAQYNWWEPFWSGEPSVVINLRTMNRSDKFPFFKIKRTTIEARQWNSATTSEKVSKSTIKIKFIRQKYNIRIPREKFELYVPASAERIEGLILE